jgi:DNA repair exonuclease SbcCD ATPase subunit
MVNSGGDEEGDMDRAQTNRVTMFKSVEAFLDQNNSVWSGMAPLVAAVQQFKDKLASIDDAAQKQETPIGAVGDKAAAREELEEVLFLSCEALGVLGHTSNDHELVALVKVTPTSLHRLGNEELSHRASTVLQEAKAKKSQLAALQVTQANIDELDQALQTFQATKEKPRLAISERMVQTSVLPELLRNVNDILRNQIDRLVNLFRRSNPQFVRGYRSARVVIDRPGSHASAQMTGSSPPD